MVYKDHIRLVGSPPSLAILIQALSLIECPPFQSFVMVSSYPSGVLDVSSSAPFIQGLIGLLPEQRQGLKLHLKLEANTVGECMLHVWTQKQCYSAVVVAIMRIK